MERRNLQFSVRLLVLLVAALALNFWLFRMGVLWGLIGLNFTKHVAIAALCQRFGVNKMREEQRDGNWAQESPEGAGIAVEGEGR